VKKNIFLLAMILVLSSCGLFEGGDKRVASWGNNTSASSFLCGSVQCNLSNGAMCFNINGVSQCVTSSTACDPVCGSGEVCVQLETGTSVCADSSDNVTPGNNNNNSNSNNNNNNVLSSAKDITSFSIPNAVVTTTGTNISAVLPHGSSLLSLTPTITHTGVNISPASGVAKNFTGSVTYTVMAADGTSQAYTVVATVSQTYNIGEVGPGGGLVFYDKGSISNGWRYLEAAPQDQGTIAGKQWSTVTNALVPSPGTSQAIGTGQANTAAIIAQHGATGDSAAKLCDSLTLNGKSDWFLPSMEELLQMHTAIHLVGGFATTLYSFYWSSSDNYPTTAQIIHFNDGDQSFTAKTYLCNVRCVRVF